jgi:hypothetical protein
MPGVHRHFLLSLVWHLMHRGHKKEFLLKFARDWWCWRRRLFEACRRYGLCVLNYVATSSHIHLPRHRGGERRASGPLPGLHRSEYGAVRCGRPPVEVGAWRLP